MGCVYKITFPGGLIYIGATKRDLLDRLRQHRRGDNSGYDKTKTELMNLLTLDDLYNSMEVLYIGENYLHYEGFLIKIHKSNITINRLQPSFNMNIALSIHENIGKYNIKYKKALTKESK